VVCASRLVLAIVFTVLPAFFVVLCLGRGAARRPPRSRPPPPSRVLGGASPPRKNLPGLVGAFSRLDRDARLVVAGSSVPWNPEGRRALRPALEGLPQATRDRIVFTGYVGEEDKVALLGGAEALAFPSRYEGFGLPLLEAMACGTPVLTSNVSALPEVAGEAALLVDPDDPEALADGMGRLLEDAELRDRLRRAGLARAAMFDWDRTARRTAEVLHRGAAS
jgi:glycosyltransferase involved in cell wall biosynthesis